MDVDTELGPDGDLVSAMISTAVIPRICKMIEGGAFDPYSSKDTRTLVDLAEQIEVSVVRDNLQFRLLLKAPYIVFQSAVAKLEEATVPHLTLNKPRFDPEAIPARRRYLARARKLLDNMLRWRKYAGGRYDLGAIVTTLLTKCIVPVAESGWEVGGEDVLRKVGINALATHRILMGNLYRLSGHYQKSSYRAHCELACVRHDVDRTIII